MSNIGDPLLYGPIVALLCISLGGLYYSSTQTKSKRPKTRYIDSDGLNEAKRAFSSIEPITREQIKDKINDSYFVNTASAKNTGRGSKRKTKKTKKIRKQKIKK